MPSITLLLRAEWRRRWTSWLALAFLVSLIGGTVLAGVSSAQRTSSAFPTFVNTYRYDVGVFGLKPFPQNFGHIKNVHDVAISRYFFNGNATASGQIVPSGDLSVLSLPTSHLNTTLKLLSGHLPVRPYDVLVGYSMQQQFDLHIGSTVTVPFYKISQTHEVLSSNVAPPAKGRRITFRVVGVEASMIDFPTSTPTYSVYTSAAFTRVARGTIVGAGFAQVRLVDGAKDLPRYQFYVNNLGKHGNYFVESEDSSITAIEGSVHPQVVGWWLFALFAALAGFALIGQALSRQTLFEKDAYPTLAALGFRPQQFFWLGMIRSAVVALMGGIGALVLAFLVSPLTPVGEARAAASSIGFVVEGSTFLLGLLAIVVVVLVLAIVPAWRGAQVEVERRRENQTQATGVSKVATGLAAMGSPPSVLIGVRNALERGRGRTSVPLTTALVGTVLAVAALVASMVFGASLTNLLSTPRLYGANWQVDLQNVSNRTLKTMLPTLKANHNVDRVTYGGIGKFINVNGVPVQSIYVNVAKGPMVFSLVSGRYPTGFGQLDLGETSLKQAHAQVGSRVSVSVVDLKGVSHDRDFTVAGTVAIPPSEQIGGLGDGAVILISALENLACSSGPSSAPCIAAINNKIASGDSWRVEIGVRSTPAGLRLAKQLRHKYAATYTVPTRPTDLVNFGQAVDFPLLLGITLALFGVATLTHVLFVSVTRRRRQFALLKVLGFVRRQVRTAMCWQATTIAVIGVLFGVPLGVLAGKVVWKQFASGLGAVPVAVVSVGTTVMLIAVILVGAILLSIVPATLAARIAPAEALRES
jgi:ABC-type lipoprotein release transport system permease subunit